jgi:tetratricopeptide (TPR) repeat protein
MKSSDQRKPKWILLFCVSAALFLSLGVDQRAQTQKKLPAPTSHVNDLAGVVDEKTRQQLENLLENVKLKTGIEFDIATVESTAGQDIFDFSRQLARDWNIGARTSVKKSLLLVVSVGDKTSFTQFSKSVQSDLPEGVLGEMGQRLRAPVAAGQFSEGLNAAVQHFVTSLAQKLALSPDVFSQPPETVAVAPTPTPETLAPAESAPEVTGPPATKSTDEAGPALTKPDAGHAAIKTPSARRDTAARTKKQAPVVDDEAESEAVELTLTKPLEQRVVLLQVFIDTHLASKSMGRAKELLVSARAALGDERLKNGDRAGGTEQLLLAIADAPLNPSEKLFSGVISQIPLNLYMRNEPAAAAKAAQDIEAKFGADPKRLLTLAGYYISTERGSEAIRLATKAVQLAPDLAEAHEGLGLALHISLRLDEAAAEYKRALELNPNSKSARRSLADLDRAFGKSEDALAFYRQQLDADPKDKAARNGMILSLLDLGRADEAKSELEKATAADPRNVTLLAGAAYWFAAHNDNELALRLAGSAVAVEPRYTWSQIALARALVAQRKPLDAERALRFARQYGKFPTLDYELASTLAAASLYDEAAEVLMQSFSVKDGEIETRLGGQAVAKNASFIELLAPERRASIFQSTAADTENNAKLLKALLLFTTAINVEPGGTINEENATAAAKEFAGGDDAARVHRQLYAASRLLQKGIGYQAAYELAEAARSSAAAGLTVPALTLAIQADEFRAIRARAIAAGGTPDIPEAPRNVLSNLLRGRIEDLTGWALFNQDKLDEAVDHLKRAVAILPEGTPAAHTSLWHLGAALERQDKKSEALNYYIKSYNSGEPDAGRRAIIEQLYRKVNGSLEGLDVRIGPGPAALSSQTTAPENASGAVTQPPASSSPESAPAATPEPAPEKAAPQVAEASPTPAATPESTPAVPSGPTGPTSPAAPTSSPEATPEASPSPPTEAPAPSESTSSAATSSLSSSPVEKLIALPRATVTITGRVKDENGNPLANVVVVLISPLGTVLASTTDDQGNFSFTVATSSATRSYRIIPSKDGLAFEPVDRVLPVSSDDTKDLNFVGKPIPKP